MNIWDELNSEIETVSDQEKRGLKIHCAGIKTAHNGILRLPVSYTKHDLLCFVKKAKFIQTSEIVNGVVWLHDGDYWLDYVRELDCAFWMFHKKPTIDEWLKGYIL
jgi:hypothetical protein